MTTQSNLYVEKINSEHPLAVWMLNERVDYLSTISEVQRRLDSSGQWTLTNATATQEDPIPETTPIKSSLVSRLSGSVPTSSPMEIEAVSAYNINLSNLDRSLASWAIGFNIYFDNPYAETIQYGYQYYDSVTSTTIDVLQSVVLSSLDANTWQFYSNTFELPPVGATAIKLVIRISVVSGGGINDYDFLINGLSVGQWSEDFNKNSVGVRASAMPSDIALPSSLKVIDAVPYGASTLNGYYLANNSNLFAKYFGIPLVYGSSNVTKIFDNVISGVNYPSIILPGYGFLNDRGRYNDYTAEMWIRVSSDTLEPKKIFGPISSNDGLYVEGGFLTIVVGDNYKSHYVGEWHRPMLIHIRIIKDTVTLVLNGEEVAEIPFDQTNIGLPSEFDGTGKSQDWLGFYAYADVYPIDIDSFSIYSYAVPTTVAKRRWVWGQAVVAPETTNASLNGTTVFNDYSFADYAVNYNYPDFATWRQAFFSNLEASSKFLTLPDYKLPEFSLGSKTSQEWFDQMQSAESSATDKYFTFRPNSGWSTTLGFMFFESLGVLSETVESLYGVFETDGTAVNQVLFKIDNKITKDSLTAQINGNTLSYRFLSSGVNTLIQEHTVSSNTKFTAGINIKNLSSQPIIGINRFFTNQSNLTVLVAGDKVTTFTGKVYRFGFDASYNNRKISSKYDQEGLFLHSSTVATQMLAHTANYTLKVIEKYGLMFADIAVSGYWEDYMPLSYFAKYTEDYDGNRFYDVDSIQFNLDFPEPLETKSLESTSSWTYSDLAIRYSSPIQQTYASLDNNFYSGWDNYEDMSQDSDKYYYYDTERSAVRSYISFQYTNDGANTNLVDFPNFATARVKGTADPALISGNWEDTAYEVIDGTIIYPPTKDRQNNSVDFNDIALVYHLDFNSEGILHHPVKFRKLQLASQVLERKQFTEIGTKFGVPVYPYKKTGIYYDFKGKNPISTYKGSTPYLYLNKHSGWRIQGDFSEVTERGISIPVNVQKGLGTEVSTIQMWAKFANRVFPTGAMLILSVDHKNGIYDFYLQGDASGQRGYVYAVNRLTNAIIDTVQYYVNGQSVQTPYLTNEEWTVLSIAFTDLLSFDQYTGRINLNGPLTYNNVSYYLATNLEQNQRVQVRTWGDIKDDGTPRLWDYWENAYTWNEVKIVNTINLYSIDPTIIYDKYMGTNRIIVDDEVDGISVAPEDVRVYNDVTWSTTTKIAV